MTLLMRHAAVTHRPTPTTEPQPRSKDITARKKTKTRNPTASGREIKRQNRMPTELHDEFNTKGRAMRRTAGVIPLMHANNAQIRQQSTTDITPARGSLRAPTEGTEKMRQKRKKRREGSAARHRAHVTHAMPQCAILNIKGIGHPISAILKQNLRRQPTQNKATRGTNTHTPPMMNGTSTLTNKRHGPKKFFSKTKQPNQADNILTTSTTAEVKAPEDKKASK